MPNKEEINSAYYYTDINPTLDSLKEIITMCETFNKEGGDRLMCAMDMRRWDLDEIERLTGYILQSRLKMEPELKRLNKFKVDFNAKFATNHNDYYNSVAIILQHIRSHTSPLKLLLQKTCPRQHPDQRDCRIHGISSKSVMKSSILVAGPYQKTAFNLDDPSTPAQVSGLFQELEKFFDMEAECMKICVDMINEEKEIRKDPQKSKYLLDNYRNNAYKKQKGLIILISDDIISMLKQMTPAFQRYKNYATEEAFAQEEFHRHNENDMDHFCLIEMAVARQQHQLDNDELANWGNNPERIKEIKCVIEHFDELLPDYFTHKMMGRFQYYFCKWALPGNIKSATEYFNKHYHGNLKVTKYGSVNTHSSEYDQNSPEVKAFLSAIQTLLNKGNTPKHSVFSA